MVDFNQLEAEKIEACCASEERLDGADTETIQVDVTFFIDHPEGSYSSVMVLPFFDTAEFLKQVGIAIL